MNYVSLFASLLLGIYAYRHMPAFFRVLFFQLVFYLVFHEAARLVIYYQKEFSIPQNNHLVYNLAMPVEAGLLSLAACLYFPGSSARVRTIIVFLLFLLVYIIELNEK